ncbi:MAG: hypothetical protein WC655_12160 [Candidatus Hydrogenedentales bacterium]|jgi:hypothetical protein
MALTEFQRTICHLIARNRIESGESYIAGGVALNAVTSGERLSRDIDPFHDTVQSVAVSWDADRGLMETHGYIVRASISQEALCFHEGQIRGASPQIRT